MNIPFLDLTSLHAEIEAELDTVWESLKRSSQFVGGDMVDRFEAEWATYCNVEHCVGVSSGTAALELSLRALGIGAGDHVIVPANTFIATAAAVVAAGAEPVFVDVDPTTQLVTADLIGDALTTRTAAVIVVHLYGCPADMDAIGRVAHKAGIAVIEDAAQAHGARWNGKKAGGLGDAGCFSFYPGKNLGAFGDAGAVVTNDAVLAARVRAMMNHGRPPGNPHLHEVIGSNDRLDALQAAVLSIKLRHLEGWNAARARAVDLYRAGLRGLPIEMVAVPPHAASSYHLMVVMCDDRYRLQSRLAAEGIATGIHYPIPCHRQPAFRAKEAAPLPAVERAAERVLSLPLFPHITRMQIDGIVEAIRHSFARPGDTAPTHPKARRATMPGRPTIGASAVAAPALADEAVLRGVK